MTEVVNLDQASARLLVFAVDGSCLEGVVVGNDQDDTGRWDLDGRFVLLTDGGERFSVNGWCCDIEEAPNE